MDTVRQIGHLALMSHEENIKKFLLDKKQELGGAVPLADLLGVSDRAVDTWLSGKRHPKRGNLSKLAEVFDLDVKDILNYGEEAEIVPEAADYIAIPYLDQEVQGGASGRAGQQRQIRSYLAFSRQWAHAKGSPASMEVLRVRGDSMSPTVDDGDVILVDRSQDDILYGHVFVVRYEGDIQIKRPEVRTDEEGKTFIQLVSDNKRHNPIDVRPGDDFQILGRVIWRASEIP